MDSIRNFFQSFPLVDGIQMYLKTIETHVDYEGQRKVERIYQVILTVFGVVGFIWGFTVQQLSAAVYCVLGGFTLSCLIILPPWSYLRRNPLPWQKSEKEKKTKNVDYRKKK